MTQRIVLTGAQGFLGRFVAAHWLAADPGVEIVGLGRSPRRADAFTHDVRWGRRSLPAPLTDELAAAERSSRYRYVELDLARTPILTGLLRELVPSVVVHLAGELRDAPADRLFAGNAAATASLFEAIAGAGVELPRVVVGSSCAVYDPSAPVPFREDAPQRPLSLYAASKRAAEDAACAIAERHGIPTILARIFNPIGPGQDERHVAGRLAAQVAAIAAGRADATIEVGPLDRTRDFLDARDVARALHLLADRGEAGAVYNVASGVETSIEGLVAALVRAAGLEGCVKLQRRAAVTGLVQPDRLVDPLRHVADAGRLRALGFAPEHTLASSLRDLLAYYRGPVARASAAAPLGSIKPPADAPLSVSVEARITYPVEIAPGLFRAVPSRLRALFPAARMVVLDDTRVHALYGEKLVGAMRAAGIEASGITVPNDESSKSVDVARDVIDRMYRLGFDRRSVLVNLGGGMITDLGGWVAAIYLRGVAYVNVPTTLLAQHDSAIGGKVAVNAPWAKNFVGAFHHPRAVYADPELLKTLGRREIAAGIAEAIKVALIADPALFDLLEARADRALGGDTAVLAEVVRHATAGKIALLAPDPYEHDLRRALNLGHTFGHALEVELGYQDLLHGEAVAFGIAVAAEIARARGMLRAIDADRIHALLSGYALPPPVARTRLESARRRLSEIRLVRGGKLHFVLPSHIGAVRIVPEVSDEEIGGAVAALAKHPILGASVVTADGGAAAPASSRSASESA